ncbi:uncharacterized protein [Oscarella lobularis]|uniref:uncharacterized protein n=1 Tax=Oscarella lobularis TaxID=121494 RepID=UPI003313E2B0
MQSKSRLAKTSRVSRTPVRLSHGNHDGNKHARISRVRRGKELAERHRVSSRYPLSPPRATGEKKTRIFPSTRRPPRHATHDFKSPRSILNNINSFVLSPILVDRRRGDGRFRRDSSPTPTRGGGHAPVVAAGDESSSGSCTRSVPVVSSVDDESSEDFSSDPVLEANVGGAEAATATDEASDPFWNIDCCAGELIDMAAIDSDLLKETSTVVLECGSFDSSTSSTIPPPAASAVVPVVDDANSLGESLWDESAINSVVNTSYDAMETPSGKLLLEYCLSSEGMEDLKDTENQAKPVVRNHT